MSYRKVKLNHISLKSLEVGHVYKYSIFYKNDENIFEKLISKDSSFSSSTQQTIDLKNISDLYVLTQDYPQYELDTQEYLSLVLKNQDISIAHKFEIVQDMAADTMGNLFQSEINTNSIQRVNALLDDTIDLILHEKSAIKAMLDVTSYDYYTYTHCVNVSLYTLGFGVFLNIPKEKLKLLTKAAMLHDLGKKNIPKEIVNKNGKLTDEEFTVMKKHPTYSVELLKNLGETDQLLFDLIEQHHEKLDGSGYPNGLQESELNSYSQIIAIADIFDALTTKRSYKDAMNSYRALEIMHTQMSNELNLKLLNEFIVFMSDKTN